MDYFFETRNQNGPQGLRIDQPDHTMMYDQLVDASDDWCTTTVNKENMQVAF